MFTTTDLNEKEKEGNSHEFTLCTVYSVLVFVFFDMKPNIKAKVSPYACSIMNKSTFLTFFIRLKNRKIRPARSRIIFPGSIPI